MFSRDQRRVARWLKPDPAQLVPRLVTMAALSIQQPWSSVGDQLADVDAGEDSRFLWGHKRQTFEWFNQQADHGPRLYHVVDVAVRAGRIARAHRLLMLIPGIGLVKGGFILQLGWGVSGCLDTVNVQRLGLPTAPLRSRKECGPRTQAKRIKTYLRMIEAAGGTRQLWDDWCRTLAEKDRSFKSAADVSSRHWRYLMDWKPVEEELPV